MHQAPSALQLAGTYGAMLAWLTFAYDSLHQQHSTEQETEAWRSYLGCSML